MTSEFKANQRVRRKDIPGCNGVVKESREEITATTGEGKRAIVVRVLWDNGTESYFSPKGLELAAEK